MRVRAAPPAMPINVSSVLAKSTTFFPTWSYAAVLAFGRHIHDSLQGGRTNVFNARVEGYTTPAVKDIGAASVRLRFAPQQTPWSDQDSGLTLKDGGYLFGIRNPALGGKLLPAVAGVPGRQGLDRYYQSRIDLAECVVMGRPATDDTVTVLPEEVLRDWMPPGSDVEVVVVTKLTDFFLGLNAGTWLRIRIDELVTKGQSWVHENCQSFVPSEQELASPSKDDMLEGTGLVASGEVGLGIPDSSAEFQYWGGSGNSGISGQVILPAEGTKFAAETFLS